MRFGTAVIIAATCVVGAAVRPMPAEPRLFAPVTPQMLEQPSPADWLMFSRTYDAQRFSHLIRSRRKTSGGSHSRGHAASAWG